MINKDLCAKQLYRNNFNRGLATQAVLLLQRCAVTRHRSQTTNCR